MQWQDVSPRWPWLVGMLVVNYALAAVAAVIQREDANGRVVSIFVQFFPGGIWEGLSLVLAIVALLLVRQRSIQLACCVLFPLLLAYVIVLVDQKYGSRQTLQRLPEALILGIISVAMAALLTGIHWLMGWSIRLGENEPLQKTIRFRLVDVMAWTLAVSLPLMLWRLFRVEEVFIYSLTDRVLYALLMLGVGLTMVLIVLGFRNEYWARRFPLLLFLGYVVIRAIGDRYFGVTVTTNWAWVPSIRTHLVYFGGHAIGLGLTLLGNLFALRFLGYRWQRVAA